MERTPHRRRPLSRRERRRRHRSRQHSRQRRRRLRQLQRRRLSSEWNRLSRIEPQMYDEEYENDADSVHSAGSYFGEAFPAWEQDFEELANQKCIICYELANDVDGPIIFPCNCQGETGRFHYNCLCEHIETNADNPCTQCGAQYTDPRIERYVEHPYSGSTSAAEPRNIVEFRDYWGAGQSRFMNLDIAKQEAKEEEDEYRLQKLMEAIAIMDEEANQAKYAIVYEDPDEPPPMDFPLPAADDSEDDEQPPGFQSI